MNNTAINLSGSLLEETLGNEQWMKDNVHKIKAIFPETWTHVANLKGLQIAFQLKLHGVDWRSEEEFAKCMMFFEKTGVLQRDGLLVRRAP